MSTATLQLARPVSAVRLRARVYESLASLPPSYARLFGSAAQESFFLELDWFKHLAATVLASHEHPRIFTVENDLGQPLLALPMRFSTRQPATQMRELSSLANYYTSFYSPLCSGWDGPQAQDAVRELARLITSDSRRWDAVRLHPLPHDQVRFQMLADAFRHAGLKVQEYFCFGNWFLPVEGRSYRQYFDSLPSVTRNTLLRKGKKLSKSGRAAIQIITGNDGLEAALDAYQKVYASSWKVPEPYPDFIPGLVCLAARNGWLRLGVVHVDGQPAAAQLWIVNNRIASIYKLAYDERFSDLSVGSVLTATLMEHVLDQDKVVEVDYLTGDDPYKKQWMSHRRERWGIMAFNPRTVRGCLGMARHFGGRLLKENLKGIRSAARRNEHP